MQAEVSSLDPGWWTNIVSRIPEQYRAIDPSTEEDDIKRKKLTQTRDHVSALEDEVKNGYQSTLKRALSK